jgi:hypothetical protein
MGQAPELVWMVWRKKILGPTGTPTLTTWSSSPQRVALPQLISISSYSMSNIYRYSVICNYHVNATKRWRLICNENYLTKGSLSQRETYAITTEEYIFLMKALDLANCKQVSEEILRISLKTQWPLTPIAEFQINLLFSDLVQVILPYKQSKLVITLGFYLKLLLLP